MQGGLINEPLEDFKLFAFHSITVHRLSVVPGYKFY